MLEKLEKQIKELRSKKIFFSTHLSILMENYYHNRSSESIEEMHKLREEISKIDLDLNPFVEKYENLHHHYYVVFSTEMLGTLEKTKTKYTFQANMLSTVDCNIDTLKDGIDLKISNLKTLIDDLGQKLIYTYTNVRFDRIAKIK